MIIKKHKQFHSFTTFNMFIWIYKNKHSCKYLNTRILILEESCPTTNYVAATFLPTIGQCAHQSFSNTATPELGMVPQGIRGN